MTKKLFALALILTVSGLGIQGIQSLTKPASSTESGCITVYYDNSTDSPKSECIDQIGYVDATTVLNKAGYQLEGTDKYPSEIVCRVNNYPTPDQEPCKNMPPEDAYWAIIVNEKGHWDWAQVGIAQIKLKPGQGIGLVYVVDGQINFPS